MFSIAVPHATAVTTAASVTPSPATTARMFCGVQVLTPQKANRAPTQISVHATVVLSIGGVNNWVRTNLSLPCLAAPAARSVLRLALVALTSAMVSGSCTLRRMKSTSSAGIRPNAMVHRQPRWPTKL